MAMSIHLTVIVKIDNNKRWYPSSARCCNGERVGLMWGFMIELWVAAILSLCFASMLPTFAPHACRQISKKKIKSDPFLFLSFSPFSLFIIVVSIPFCMYG